MTTESLRQQIRAAWVNRFEESEAINVKTVSATMALAYLEDEDFMRRFAAEFLQDVIYRVGLEVLSSYRRETETQMEESVIQKRTYTRRATDIATSITDKLPALTLSKWKEHDPFSGSHILITAMTKEQGIAAANARWERTEGDWRRARLLELLCGPLAPGQTIGEHWTEEQIAQLNDSIIIERPKLQLRSVLRPGLINSLDSFETLN